MNIITNSGLSIIVRRICGLSQNPVTYMAVGSSAEAPDENTSFEELDIPSYQRVLVTAIEADSGIIVYTGTFPEDNITETTTLKQVALFDKDVGGNCLGICQISDTPKDNTFPITFEITLETFNLINNEG